MRLNEPAIRRNASRAKKPSALDVLPKINCSAVHVLLQPQGGEKVRSAEEVRRYEYEPPSEPIQFMFDYVANRDETVQVRRYEYEPPRPPRCPAGKTIANSHNFKSRVSKSRAIAYVHLGVRCSAVHGTHLITMIIIIIIIMIITLVLSMFIEALLRPQERLGTAEKRQ